MILDWFLSAQVHLPRHLSRYHAHVTCCCDIQTFIPASASVKNPHADFTAACPLTSATVRSPSRRLRRDCTNVTLVIWSRTREVLAHPRELHPRRIATLIFSLANFTAETSPTLRSILFFFRDSHFRIFGRVVAANPSSVLDEMNLFKRHFQCCPFGRSACAEEKVGLN